MQKGILDIRPQKRRLREKFKNIRKEIPSDTKAKLDLKITNKLLNLWRYRDSDLILPYVSMLAEIDTFDIIKQSLLRGKTVAVPRCTDGILDMDFYIIKSIDDLETGSFGVLEPKPEKCEKLENFDKGLCIVPALSFDKDGYRLGYGKGYYDRFLSVFGGDTIGLCYSFCVSNELLPHGKYDKNVSLLITESGIITTQ